MKISELKQIIKELVEESIGDELLNSKDATDFIDDLIWNLTVVKNQIKMDGDVNNKLMDEFIKIKDAIDFVVLNYHNFVEEGLYEGFIKVGNEVLLKDNPNVYEIVKIFEDKITLKPKNGGKVITVPAEDILANQETIEIEDKRSEVIKKKNVRPKKFGKPEKVEQSSMF